MGAQGWLGAWLLPQEASYFALALPHGWCAVFSPHCPLCRQSPPGLVAAPGVVWEGGRRRCSRVGGGGCCRWLLCRQPHQVFANCGQPRGGVGGWTAAVLQGGGRRLQVAAGAGPGAGGRHRHVPVPARAPPPPPPAPAARGVSAGSMQHLMLGSASYKREGGGGEGAGTLPGSRRSAWAPTTQPSW